jgi:hypothetical protein
MEPNPLEVLFLTLTPPPTKHHPRSEATAWRSAGDKYDGRPKDPEYRKKYYQEKLKTPITCPLCGHDTNKTQMNRHQSTKRCKEVQAFLANKLNTTASL